MVVVAILVTSANIAGAHPEPTVMQARAATLELVTRTSLNGRHGPLSCQRTGCRVRIDLEIQGPGLYVDREGYLARSRVWACGRRVCAAWAFRLRDLNQAG